MSVFINHISYIYVNVTLKQVFKEYFIADPISDQYDHLNEIQTNLKLDTKTWKLKEIRKLDWIPLTVDGKIPWKIRILVRYIKLLIQYLDQLNSAIYGKKHISLMLWLTSVTKWELEAELQIFPLM